KDDLFKSRVLGQVMDVIALVDEFTLFAVDVRDRGTRRRNTPESGAGHRSCLHFFHVHGPWVRICPKITERLVRDKRDLGFVLSKFESTLISGERLPFHFFS